MQVFGERGAGRHVLRVQSELVFSDDPGAKSLHSRTISEDSVSAADHRGSVLKAPERPIGGATKRAVDIAIASTLIVITLPLMTVLALIIAYHGGEPIYSHKRIGFGGRPFRCFKFRTMRRDGDRVLQELLNDSPEIRALWISHRKLPQDPRVTPFGRFLRRSSLDELPQLFNVLFGNMSCVGPRPVTSEELEYYAGHLDEYTAALPGITGVWQISGRNNVSMAQRVDMDIKYVKTWSLQQDFSIILRTPRKMLRAEGVY